MNDYIKKLNEIIDRSVKRENCIFSYSSNENNYVAFMIDNGYTEYNEIAIKSRWQEMYGQLNEYCFESIKSMPYILRIIGKTKDKKIVSHIFKDGEGNLEVLYEVDLSVECKLRNILEVKFEKVIASVNIEVV